MTGSDADTQIVHVPNTPQTRHSPAARRDLCDDDGALAAASSRCPNLRELSLMGFDLVAPAGAAAGTALSHLTCLDLFKCVAPGDELRLGALMPRLEV